MFVIFYISFIERENYETKVYFTERPQLSDELIKDQYCADRGVFVIENLCNLAEI